MGGLPARKDEIYGNCSVLHPDGSLMFRTDERRINWYLQRNLAKVVCEDPKVIQLSFIPKGKGRFNEPFYVSEKNNCCVVCGCTEDLTRHHAVPHCYRRYFPETIKSRQSHDVLPVCVSCHEKYEIEANKLKREIAIQHGFKVKLNQIEPHDLELRRAQAAANALMRYGDSIPAERQVFLHHRMAIYLGREATPADIEELSKLPRTIRLFDNKTAARLVAEKLTTYEDYFEFVVMWRKHFVDTMNPKFLHEHWDVNHRIATTWENPNEVGIKAQVATWIAQFVGWNRLQKLKKLFSVSQTPAATNTRQDT